MAEDSRYFCSKCLFSRDAKTEFDEDETECTTCTAKTDTSTGDGRRIFHGNWKDSNFCGGCGQWRNRSLFDVTVVTRSLARCNDCKNIKKLQRVEKIASSKKSPRSKSSSTAPSSTVPSSSSLEASPSSTVMDLSVDDDFSDEEDTEYKRLCPNCEFRQPYHEFAIFEILKVLGCDFEFCKACQYQKLNELFVGMKCSICRRETREKAFSKTQKRYYIKNMTKHRRGKDAICDKCVDAKKSSHRRVPPCTYFMRGRCRNKGSCQFSHTVHTRSRNVCFSYLRGNCHHGHLCTYSHHRGTFPCVQYYENKFENGKTPCAKDDCVFSHGEMPEDTYRLIVSKTHITMAELEERFCWEDPETEIGTAPSSSSSSSSASNQTGGSEKDTKVEKKSDQPLYHKKRVCAHFQRNGYCRYRNKCNYRHDEPCIQFMKGHCYSGIKCPRLHDVAAIPCMVHFKNQFENGKPCSKSPCVNSHSPIPFREFKRLENLMNRPPHKHKNHANGKHKTHRAGQKRTRETSEKGEDEKTKKQKSDENEGTEENTEKNKSVPQNDKESSDVTKEQSTCVESNDKDVVMYAVEEKTP